MITGFKVFESSIKGVWLLYVNYAECSCPEITKHTSKKDAQDFFMNHYIYNKI